MAFANWLRSKANRRRRPVLNVERLEDRALFHADPVGANFLISSQLLPASARELTAHQAAISTNGGVVVFQGIDAAGTNGGGDGLDILGQRVHASGEPSGSVFRINSYTRGDQSNPSVAVDQDGNFLVVWDGRGETDLQGIFAQRFAANGTPLGAAFRVNAVAEGQQYRPRIAMSPSGAAVVVWQGSGQGDMDGVFARVINSSGQPIGNDILVNSTTGGEQSFASVAMDTAGQFVVAWESRGTGANGIDIFFQRFDSAGTRQGVETRANTFVTGTQQRPAVARTADGEFFIAWSSFQQDGDGWGVFGQKFDSQGNLLAAEQRLNETTTGHQREVSLALADSGDMVVTWSHGQPDGMGWEVRGKIFHPDGEGNGSEFTVNSTANQANRGHQRLPSASISSDGATLVAFSGGQSGLKTHVSAQRYQVDVVPPANVAPDLAVIRDQTIRVGEQLSVDVSATDRNRNDILTFSLDPDQSPANATITKLTNTTARITWQPTAANRNQRLPFRVLVDDNGTPPLGDAVLFFVTVQNAPPAVDLNGPNVAGIDRTATLSVGQTSLAITDSTTTVTDADQTSLVSATVSINTILDANSETLTVDTTGTNISQSFVAATGTLLLTGLDTVEHYQQVLRSLRYENTATNRTAGVRRIEVVVNDDTANSPAANILLTVAGPNTQPTLAAISDVTLLAGSPLHIPLDADDLDRDVLTFTVTSSDPSLVTTRVLTGNRSLRMNVEGFGSMVFELFEDRAPRATNQIIQLAQSGFYDGIIFHRVVNDFVIQAGDPTGTGTSGSTLPNFDDQFHFELQHNRTGVLSMAKTTDDTNNSQFFITEGAQRHLDFNHTIFGQLVEGESVRDAISNVAVNSNSKPLSDVKITSMDVFFDNENGVVMLDAPANAEGTATITVVVTDGRGGTATRTFNVTVRPDTINGAPFLSDIPNLVTRINTPTTLQLVGRDVEGDPVFYLDEEALAACGLSVPVSAHPDLEYSVNPLTGLVTINPTNNLQGTHQFTVADASSLDGLTNFSPIDYQVVRILINESGVDPT